MKTCNPTICRLGSLFLSIFFVFTCLTSFAQDGERKAKVTIKKSDNGNKTEINEEINIEDAKDLELLLEKYGIDTELEELKDDEVLEITIQRKKDSNVEDDIRITIDPDDFNFDFEHFKPKKETVAFLGVHGESKCINGEMEAGSKITKVVEGSKAAEYGFQEGDVITKIEDSEIKGFGSLRNAIQKHEPGDKVKIEFTRDGKKEKKTIELGSTERTVRKHMNHFNWQPRVYHGFGDSGNKSFLGVTHADESASILKKGVSIGRVINNSSAEKMGLENGDVILKINGSETNSWDDLVNEIQKIETKENIEVEYLRDGNTQTATGTMQSRFHCADKSPERMELKQNEMKERIEKQMERLHEQIEEGMFELEFLGPELEELGAKLESLAPEMEELIEKIKISIELSPITEDELESTGINKSSINSLETEQFYFYPNPNNGNFTVKFQIENEENTTIRVIDLNGAEVFTETLSNFSGAYQREIDLSKEAKGSYFVQIRRGEKATTKKLVIQ